MRVVNPADHDGVQGGKCVCVGIACAGALARSNYANAGWKRLSASALERSEMGTQGGGGGVAPFNEKQMNCNLVVLCEQVVSGVHAARRRRLVFTRFQQFRIQSSSDAF